jgi:hypothetical protein
VNTTIGVTLPARGAPYDEESALKFIGQYFHLLIGGEAYMAQVYSAKRYDQGAEIHLQAEIQNPEEEPVPAPLELAEPVNVTEDGITYPCLPIACDADVRHLPGCVFAGGDSDGEEAPQVEAP